MADDGDWTWVLERRCPECGVDTQALSRDELGPHIRTVGGAWRVLLGHSGVDKRVEGNDRMWSPLEYGCHVRDVFDVFEGRVRAMLKKRKSPTFQDWDQDKAAIDGDYASADPDKVAYALATNAGKYADVIDRVRGDEWDRQGSRSDGASFTVESLTRYMLHDVEHHLWDARELLESR